MKSARFIVLVLCAILSSHLAAIAIATPTDSAGVARLTVKGDVADLNIFLDGEEIGRTPLTDYAVAPGEHRLLVRSPYWPAVHITDFDTGFVALAGKNYLISPHFDLAIRLTSVPYGAEVWRNRERLGKTPLVLSLRPGEPAGIRIEKEGYQPWEQTLTEATESLETVVLQPDWIYRQKRQELDRRKADRIKWYRRGLYGSLLLGAVSGAATIHYRGRGNDAYAAYLATANPALMDRHYDRARHYDRLAGWNYAAFEVSFILSGYFFLKSRK